ncbi:MAG: acetyl-CoA C-acetyltransferase [Desulfovermiculus sp.]|nr:acetyl-CoA C-acetyltransferase [Desulfovermiculus sp.]
MREVVIAGYLRTPQSRSRPNAREKDWFHHLRADELLSWVVQEILKRYQVATKDVEDFLVGNAFGVSENWTYGGRTPIFLANLSESVPGKYLDMQCGSGMAAVHTGYLEVAAGVADLVMASGMEHMTRVPMGPSLFEQGIISVNPQLYSKDEYQHWDIQTTMNMGLTAEKLAKQSGITREEMDEWGVRSHQLAAKAIEEGFFKDEILPIQARDEIGQSFWADKDQAVRGDVTLEGMRKLKTPFAEEGLITPGNASPLNSGAAAMLLMSKQEAEKRGIKPLAQIKSIGFKGVDPTIMGAGPVPAVEMALDKLGCSAADIDFWEINEAFAVVTLYCMQEFGLEPEKINIKGGGLALGHPLGATGVRLIGTLARILQLEKAKFGCATACVGGGQGVATIIQNLD